LRWCRRHRKKKFFTFFCAGGCDEIAVWGEGHLKYYINWWVSVSTEVRGRFLTRILGFFGPFFGPPKFDVFRPLPQKVRFKKKKIKIEKVYLKIFRSLVTSFYSFQNFFFSFFSCEKIVSTTLKFTSKNSNFYALSEV
jgi:hypothetical protein